MTDENNNPIHVEKSHTQGDHEHYIYGIGQSKDHW
jgi:hypothetical protein